MREPIIERLSRFTPEGSGLDRDAILFAAGRASARPNRGWMALAGSLAVCQLVTLAILWPRPMPAGDSTLGPIADRSATPAASEAKLEAIQQKRDESELWSRNRRMLLAADAELPPPITITGPMAPSDPPLHAYSAAALAGLE
jgi:hypothetical protein